MTQQMQSLLTTIESLNSKPGTRAAEISDILTWLERYITAVYKNSAINAKSDHLRTSLEAALTLSEMLFRNIDTGLDGPDDRIAAEIQKLKERYLGQ